MARRKAIVPSASSPIANWDVSTEIQINGRNVTKGTELKIKGERGRFRFVKHVKTATSEWVDVWGGPKGAECLRSFHMERVVRVHSKNQTYQNLAVEYKEKQKAMKEELQNDSTN